MSLFQKSVLKKYLASLNADAAGDAWLHFSRHFLDLDKQENIRNSKEEQYQKGFLRELFVDVPGYTLNPTPGFNLTTELKNVGNAKKAAALQAHIGRVDREMVAMVDVLLYGLTEEKVGIVEGK